LSKNPIQGAPTFIANIAKIANIANIGGPSPTPDQDLGCTSRQRSFEHSRYFGRGHEERIAPSPANVGNLGNVGNVGNS
jgi:hypothetical protein